MYAIYQNDMGGNIKKVKIYEVLHLTDFHFHVFQALSRVRMLSVVRVSKPDMRVREFARSARVSE